MESAAWRRVNWGRDFTCEGYHLNPAIGVGCGTKGKQGLGVRVTWIFKEARAIGQLYYLPQIHDCNPVTHKSRSGKIMGDEEVGNKA